MEFVSKGVVSVLGELLSGSDEDFQQVTVKRKKKNKKKNFERPQTLRSTAHSKLQDDISVTSSSTCFQEEVCFQSYFLCFPLFIAFCFVVL